MSNFSPEPAIAELKNARERAVDALFDRALAESDQFIAELLGDVDEYRLASERVVGYGRRLAQANVDVRFWQLAQARTSSNIS